MPPAASAPDTPPPGCPAHSGEAAFAASPSREDRQPLYVPEFFADPPAAYRRMHTSGPAVPVELLPGVPAWLVIGYHATLDVVRNPENFSKDSRRWRDFNEGAIPPDSPAAILFAWQPIAMHNDGIEHRRLRQPIVESLARIDAATLRLQVQRSADELIDQFATAGEVDLVQQFVKPLPVLVLSEMCGASEDLARRFVELIFRMVEPETDQQANFAEQVASIEKLVELKRREPGADVVSWMVEHNSGLTDEEVRQAVHLFLALSGPLLQNFIVSVLALLLVDDRFAGDLSGGSLPVDEAIDEVLWTDPPLSITGGYFPMRDMDFHGAKMREGDLVLVSYTAANSDPSVAAASKGRNRGHVAWGAGPHACPGRTQARLIVEATLERLLDRIPDMELAVPLEKLERARTPFHAGPLSLPVRFPLPQPAAPAAERTPRPEDRAALDRAALDRAAAPRQGSVAPHGSASGGLASAAVPETVDGRGRDHIRRLLTGWWPTRRRTR